MPEPTIVPESRAPRPLRRLVMENLGLATVIFALLECWRPLYFLTDDNLDGGYPLLTEIGRRMSHGKSPFYSDYLFGGHYELLRDCSTLCWHPLYLLVSLLADTPAHLFIIDLIALCFLWLAAAGFVCLANHLRVEFTLPLGDARLTLCAQSFTFSMLALCTGSSWVDFLANHCALPWLALGILQTTWRRGLALTTLFSVHSLLGGHLAATVSNTIFLTIFAAGVSAYRQRFAPLGYWLGGYALALVIISPLIVPMSEGFVHSGRAGGMSLAGMDQFSFPPLLLPVSYFLGIFSWFLKFKFQFGYCPPWYSAAFASCAAAWMIVPALASRARWRSLEILCLALAAFAAILVVRPLWLGGLMTHLPVIRSMRWPFREILQLQFFLHVFLVLRPLGGSRLFQLLTIIPGVFIFVCPLFFLSAPSFNPMGFDRALLFSGTSARYWERVKPLLQPGEVIVPMISPNLGVVDCYTAPYSLIGAYNYPALFQVTSATGYSLTTPLDQVYVTTIPVMNSGIYVPAQQADILKQRPHARFVTLESVSPLQITLSSPTGPIDLTPFLSEP